MGLQNDCSPALDGKKAALDLANASSENFSNTCWNIDNRLKTANPEYARNFMSAMNSELEDRNLLPKVELNMVAQSNSPALQALQDRHKHVGTTDLVQAEDYLGSTGRNVESNLVHGLITHQDEIQSTHAERNFWGTNHKDIDMDRLQRWSDQNRPDMYGAVADIHEPNSRVALDTPRDIKHDPELKQNNDDNLNRTKYDAKQDAKISSLTAELAKENKAQEDLQKAAQLKEKVEAGVKKDACHTVTHGETLYDMACLALNHAGRVHITPGAIRFEEEKIRTLNNLAPHENLRSGQSLMLRTQAEVERETTRRIQMIEATAKPAIKPAIEPTIKPIDNATSDDQGSFDMPWGSGYGRRGEQRNQALDQYTLY